MLGAGVGRRQQQEHQVDLAAVDRLVIDRGREPRDQRIDAVEPGELAVRDRHPAAEAGRAEPFALADRIGDLRRVERQPRARDLRQLAEQLALVVDRRGRHGSLRNRGIATASSVRKLCGTGAQRREQDVAPPLVQYDGTCHLAVRFDPADRAVLPAIDHVERRRCGCCGTSAHWCGAGRASSPRRTRSPRGCRRAFRRRSRAIRAAAPRRRRAARTPCRRHFRRPSIRRRRARSRRRLM